ncbi:hypothetical protein [Egbenema bharatensis]|uniref:hypothetical protein n=1 Tax=Egbenema bharatensis TaxID=3463334 RepID=UPI003A8B86B4
MTSETSQIQTLIHQIDEVLNKTSPRLPWVMSSDAAQQRQVLEQTRHYLLSLQSEKANSTDVRANAGSSQDQENRGTTATHPEASAEASAQQVLQSVLQEMTYLRTNMLQPMRSDVEVLQHQREALLQEVRRLEMQRQQYVMAQQPPAYFQEYMQAAMKQIQENLSGQVAQMMAAMTAQNAQLQGSESISGDLAALSPVERLERLRAIQSQSDQLLLRLDTTLRVVFESLQRNLQSYQDSLGEGLGRMHDMGQQGEAVFAAFVARLAQILGREASSFLQNPQSGWGEERLSYEDTARTLPGQETEPDRLKVENDPDQQISRLLEELNALDQSGANQTASGEPVPFAIDDPNSPLSPEAERERLEELDRELSQLDLSALSDLPTGIEVSPLAEEEDPFFPFPPFSEDEQSLDHSPTHQQPTPPPEPAPLALDDDLDSALDLLSQISAAVPEAGTEPGSNLESEPELRINPSSPEAGSTPVPQTEFASTPDDLYQDEFYQDFFGSVDEPKTSQVENPVEHAAENPVEHTVEHTADDRASETFGMMGDRLPEESIALEVEESDVNHDLFAGLADPSQSDPFPAAGEDLPHLEPFSEFPQSVENLLVQPAAPQPPIEDLTLDTFLSEDLPDPLAGIEPEPAAESVETIASLADLIPDIEPESSVGGDRSSARPDDEAYETAHPGEDLLITESASPEPASNLRLPADTLQQLTHDLFNLEDTPPAVEVTESSWTLADWTEAVDASPPPGTGAAGTNAAGTAPEPDAIQPFQASDWTDGRLDHPPTRLSNLAIEQLLFTDRFAGDSSSHPPIDSARELKRDPATDPANNPAPSSPSQPGTQESTLASDADLGTTIEDWFANVDADPVVTPESSQQEPTAQNSETNTFTLDGLDSLFEGVPTAPPPRQPSETDTQRITIDDVFGGAFAQSPPTDAPPQDNPSELNPPSRTADREVEKKKHRWNGSRSDS